MKIKEYLERMKDVERVEKKAGIPENYKLVSGIDASGMADEQRVKISYRKLPLGGGNLGAHRDRDFNVEMRKIKNEMRRLGL